MPSIHAATLRLEESTSHGQVNTHMPSKDCRTTRGMLEHELKSAFEMLKLRLHLRTSSVLQVEHTSNRDLPA